MDNPTFPVFSDRCENLRWKNLFIDDQAVPGPDTSFWCLKTQFALGPDGETVGKYECSPGRSCYRGL